MPVEASVDALERRAERVLVVDDDPTVSAVVAAYLRRDGFMVEICGDGTAAVASALDDEPSVVLLDLNLPGCSGVEVMQHLHAAGDTPVIIMTSRRDEGSRVRGLEMGADDYVTKPFSPREMTARVHALLRRCTPHAPAQAVVVAGGLRVEVAERRVWNGQVCIDVTSLEQALLLFLMRHAGTTVTRAMLLRKVWGFTHGEEAAVTVQVRRLRQKIEDDPSHPCRITTVWGKGYRFEPDQSTPTM